MSPVPGGSADSLAAGGVVETRGGQLDNPRGDVSSPSAKHLRWVSGVGPVCSLCRATLLFGSHLVASLHSRDFQDILSVLPGAAWNCSPWSKQQYMDKLSQTSLVLEPFHTPFWRAPNTEVSEAWCEFLHCSTSTAPSLPPASRLGSLSSADLCAVAAPQPRPTLDIARLDPTTSLHSNGGGGNGHGNGGGNGNGSNGGSVHGGQALGRNGNGHGNGNGNGNGDTARSGPPGAAGASGMWTAGPGGGSGGGGDGGCRLPPVSEAAVLATNAAGGMPVQQAQLQSAGADPARQPGANATAGALPVAGDKTPQGGRADRQQHSGSGGSSNSPDEGHERRAAGVVMPEQKGLHSVCCMMPCHDLRCWHDCLSALSHALSVYAARPCIKLIAGLLALPHRP